MTISPPDPLVDLRQELPALQFEIVYATPENVVGHALYREPHAWLHREACQRLRRVLTELKDRWGFGIRIWDAFRPFEAQEALWKRFPLPGFVAEPIRSPEGAYLSGSNHTRGTAIDATLFDLKTGRPLEMPTGFDDFSKLAHRTSGFMSPAARRNLNAMEEAFYANGFKGLETEWWHYDLVESREFPLIKVEMAPHSAETT